jgi:hypothetical protein
MVCTVLYSEHVHVHILHMNTDMEKDMDMDMKFDIVHDLMIRLSECELLDKIC